MTGEQVKRLRERQGWTQQQMGEMVGRALERKYNGRTISEWESGRRNVPEHVSVFLTELGLETLIPESDTEPKISPDGQDLAPAPDEKPIKGQTPLSSSGVYAKVCEEMWEMVATGVGMVGAVTGSDKLRRDGAIIDADKEALGKAYGRLAETNEVFRNMIASVTTSGAWLEVAFVTGTTAGKIMRNHQEPLPGLREVSEDGGSSRVVAGEDGEPELLHFPAAQ